MAPLDLLKGEDNGVTFNVTGLGGAWITAIKRYNGVRDNIQSGPRDSQGRLIVAGGATGQDLTMTAVPSLVPQNYDTTGSTSYTVTFVLHADPNARADSYYISDLILADSATNDPAKDLYCSKTGGYFVINVKAPPSAPSTLAVCPQGCTKELMQSYIASNFSTTYQDFLNYMILQESHYYWNVIADDGFNCPSSNPCYGILQFMSSTWDTGPSLVGAKSGWTEADVYPDQSFASSVPSFGQGQEAASNFPDNNIWNPFGQIEVTYEKLRLCHDREWPWLYDRFGQRAPGCG